MHAHEIGFGTCVFDGRLDHAREPVGGRTRLRVTHETAVARARGVPQDLPVDRGTTSARTLELLENEDPASFSRGKTARSSRVGRQHSGTTVVGEEKPLELRVGPTAERNVEVVFFDEPECLADRARPAHRPLGHRSAEALRIVRDGKVACGQIRQRLQRVVERIDVLHAEAVRERQIKRAGRVA